MNKYQESLNFIIKNSCHKKITCKECDFEKYCNSIAKEKFDNLQELVEKVTPKKLDMMRYKKYDGYNIGICKCGAIIDTSLNDDEINYCHKCGQKIDWEE